MRTIELTGAGVNGPGFNPVRQIVHRQAAGRQGCGSALTRIAA